MKRTVLPVAASAVVSGVSGYVVIFVAARFLGSAGYAEFAVFWALLYVVIGFLFGIQQETTRIVRAATQQPTTSGPRIVALTAAIGVVIGVGILLTGLLWGPPVFGDEWLPRVGLIALSSALFAGQLTITGFLGGQRRWGGYAWVLIVEAVARLVLFVIVAAVAPEVGWFALAAVAAFIAWCLLVPALPLRELPQVRAGVGVGTATGRYVQAMLASGASGVLVNGFPAILTAAAALTAPRATAGQLGVLILLVTLTRAPLMVPLTAFTSAIVAGFVGLDGRAALRALRRPLLLVVAASLALAALAWLVGPPLLPIIFGAEFVADGWLIGVLTFAAAGLGIITITGAAALAALRHTAYLVGWIGTISLAIGLLLVPVPLDVRVAVALAVAPLLGAGVHLVALQRSGRTVA